MESPRSGERNDPERGDAAPALGRSFELLERYKQGDERALEELLERYYPRLHRLARQRLRPQQRLHAGSMDVVQETWLVALGRLAAFEFKEPRALLRYLSKILDNQLRDLSKKGAGSASARVRAIQDSSDGSGVQLEGREPQPYESLSVQEFQDIRADCVAALEPGERDLLLLKEVGDATWQEIADECGCTSAHAAEQRYQRAKNRRDVLILRRVRFA